MEPSRRLTVAQLESIREYLSISVGNKAHQSERNNRKAAAMFYRLNEIGYRFIDEDIDRIKLKEKGFSEKMIENFRQMANAYYDLICVIDDPKYDVYRTKIEKLIEPD